MVSSITSIDIYITKKYPLGTLRKVSVPKRAEFISCTLFDTPSVGISLVFMEHTHSRVDDILDTADHVYRRYMIIADNWSIPYVHFKHIASFGRRTIHPPTPDNHNLMRAIHVFEITHPQKAWSDCQEPCEWENEDEKDESK